MASEDDEKGYDPWEITVGEFNLLYKEDPKKLKVMIKCMTDGSVYEVDKDKLMAKSDYFKAMLSHDFKESKSDVIELHEDDPAAVETFASRLQEYLVTPWCLTGSPTKYKDITYLSTAELTMAHHCALRVFILANKYAVRDLIDIGRSKMSEFVALFIKRAAGPEEAHDWFLKNHYNPLCGVFGNGYTPSLYRDLVGNYADIRKRFSTASIMHEVIRASHSLHDYLFEAFLSDCVHGMREIEYLERILDHGGREW